MERRKLRKRDILLLAAFWPVVVAELAAVSFTVWMLKGSVERFLEERRAEAKEG